MSKQANSGKPLRVTDFAAMKSTGEKIACLTAYDASFAAQLDRAGVDLALVGDSLGNVIQGRSTTLPVTVEHMAYHCQAVARGLHRTFLVCDLPWMSYNEAGEAVENAGWLMAEGGASMVKMEGGGHVCEITSYLTGRGIPVCGHLGLTPQWVHKFGGFKVQGKQSDGADWLRAESRALADAGAELLVLECVPADLGAQISEELAIPVIGIGAGPDCDGQILVLYDALGITPGKAPRFSRDFTGTGEGIPGALDAYVSAVKSGGFPTDAHSF